MFKISKSTVFAILLLYVSQISAFITPASWSSMQFMVSQVTPSSATRPYYWVFWFLSVQRLSRDERMTMPYMSVTATEFHIGTGKHLWDVVWRINILVKINVVLCAAFALPSHLRHNYCIDHGHATDGGDLFCYFAFIFFTFPVTSRTAQRNG